MIENGTVRRLTAPLAVFALISTACGTRDIRVEPRDLPDDAFAIQIVDFDQDAGRGLSLASDADGNPHMSYVALPEEAQGEATPPAPGDPVLPAVKHAHLTGEGWTRSVVADGTPPAEGEQAVDTTSELSDTDTTAIAVSAEGVHHVVWTSGAVLYHSSNAEGEFGPPVEVASAEGGEISGPSVAVDEQGNPWVAFYEIGTAPGGEGPDALLRVAAPDGGSWEVQTAAEASPSAPSSTAIAATGDGPILAFGSGGETLVARREGGSWATETADDEGGLGVSMSVDGEGNPHLAYINAEGQVRHAHSVGGGGWEASEVAPDADLTAATSIAVDAEGIHHVTWQLGEGVAYANNAEGGFALIDVEGGQGGAAPKVAAGASGAVNIAWYDAQATSVKLGTLGGDAPLLAYPSPQPGGGDGGDTGGPPACEPEGTELAIAALNSQFDKDCLAAPAGQAFTIAFDNQDASIPHNVSIYTQEGGEPLFEGETITGTQTTYQVDPLEAGNLYFQCDVHPTTMQGDFAVA